MSNYPLWWNNTITIYNKHIDSSTNIITWYKTVIPRCFWKSTGNKVNIGTVMLDTESVICRIPENPGFLPKGEWDSCEFKESHFTIGIGDLVFFGELLDEINEYSTGKHSTDIIKKYRDIQSCIEVKQFAINIGIGRNNPHYLVKGV